MPQNKIQVVSLFSGAMGLDLGLEEAGFEVVVAVECDKQAIETIRLNKPDLPVISKKIEEVTAKEILDAANLKAGDPFMISGGPCCQAFSTAGRRESLSDPRGSLFQHFLRIVRQTRPKFFVMENVTGLLSAAVTHRPLNQRGPGFPALSENEELGSAFRVVLTELRRLRYYTVFDVLNAADYGVPQSRRRIVFIGSRDGQPISMPSPTHAADETKGLPQWKTLKDVIWNLQDKPSVSMPLPPLHARFLAMVPEGGNWRSLPTELQREALGSAFVSWGGRAGFYRRLSWEKPAPSLTTQPNSKATMLCHPVHLRPLSLAEYARIQEFPEHWQFGGTMTSQYRQMGNAVPVGLGRAIGKAVADAWRRRGHTSRLGLVKTHNVELVRRISNRPTTLLNPPRMRPNKLSAVGWRPRGKRAISKILARALSARGE